MDLPCAVAGFDAPPCAVRFRLFDDEKGWNLLVWVPPGNIGAVARWLEAYAPSHVLIGPGDAPEILQARFARLPPRWSWLFTDRAVHSVEAWPTGMMKITLMGRSAVMERFEQALGWGQAGGQVASPEESEYWRESAIYEARRYFVQKAMHELNTPLTPIILQVERLKDSYPSAGVEEGGLAVIHRNAVRLGQTVHELFARTLPVERPRLDLACREIRLDQVLVLCIESFRPAAARVGVNLVFEEAPQVSLLADVGRLTQALFNILSAAILFAPRDGSIRCRLEVDASEATITVGGELAALEISAEACERLFHPPELLGPGPLAVPGARLELFIAKTIIEAHGGRLFSTSAGDGGEIAIRLTLPHGVREPQAE